MSLKNPLEIQESDIHGVVDKYSDLIKYAKGKGHDGIIVSGLTEKGFNKGKEYIAFDSTQIKTKAQLTDIWNKAQEKKVVKKPVVGGFTAKEILDRRRTSIRTIRDYFGLTDYELRQITKRDIRLMSNKEFKEFKDNIEIKAQKN